MPRQQRPSHLRLILTQPWKLVRSIYHTSALGVSVFLNRLLLPFACRAVDFRTQLYRCYLGGFLANFWDLLFKAPLNLKKSRYADEKLGGVPCVIIPRDAAAALQESKHQDITTQGQQQKPLILLYAHGGGYAFGEPLMYIETYERWIRRAKEQGLKLVVVSVDYSGSIHGITSPLSPDLQQVMDDVLTISTGLIDEAKFPACRNDFVNVYRSLVEDFHVNPALIVFGGDSAGGGLTAMSALEIRRQGLSAPGGIILISPWVDLEMAHALHSPAMATDFLITFSQDNPILVNSFLPEGMKANDPRVSPVFDNLHSLPPQLILAGTAEVLLPDSLTWARRSKQAGNKVEFILERGQMHM